MADVATTKLFENEKVVVWEMVLEPGETTGVHTHGNDYLFYAIEGSTVEVMDEDGEVLDELEVPTGSVMYLGIDGDELVLGENRFPVTHDAKNIGTTRYREFLVEIK